MESPDGKFVYFGKDSQLRSIWRIPAAGGQEEHVLAIHGGWSGFTVAGDGIYYLADTLSPTQPSSTASIEFLRPATGE